MATINHANCDHPRTPAGRAACRKAGGPDATMAAKPKTVGVVKTDGTAGRMIVAPRGRGRRAAGADMKPRALRNEGDLAYGVPHVFSNAIRAAWDAGWDVRTGQPYNDAEKRVEIVSPAGTASFVYRGDNHGVWGVFWRPADSSVTSCITDAEVGIVAEAIRRLGM
jgi:hypothetical protein